MSKWTTGNWIDRNSGTESMGFYAVFIWEHDWIMEVKYGS